MGPGDYLCSMLILLDCRPLQHTRSGAGNEQSRFILSTALLLAREQEVEWLFLVDHTYKPGSLSGLPNPSLPGSLLIRRALPGRLGSGIWQNRLLPRLARKYKASLIIRPAGATPGAVKLLLLPFPPFSPGEAPTLLLTPTPRGSVRPLLPAEKATARTNFAEGKEFFLALLSGTGENALINLLKAFSLFKKRQRSNMRLVLAGDLPGPRKGLTEKLATYKYREEVHWYDNPGEEDVIQMTGAAYALLFCFGRNTLGGPLPDAWKTGTPVIATGPAGELPAWATAAVIHAPPDNPPALAAQLMLLYKDETIRQDLIAKGSDHPALSGSNQSAGELWKAIRMVKNN
jgi:hypothetical protein